MHALTLPAFPRRPDQAHKGTCGTVLIVAGSARFPGAAALAALGAGRAGAGLVRLACPAGIEAALVGAVPFATVRSCEPTADGGLAAQALGAILEEAATADAVVVGPGLGVAEGTAVLLADLLKHTTVPVVIDADGLNLLARWRASAPLGRAAATILTPHPGEFARLTGRPRPQGDPDRLAQASALAARLGVVVALKGHRTVVTDGERYRVEPAGNPGMATGGMGDVLAGMAGAFAAVFPDAAAATALAVHIHAVAGDRAAAEMGQEALLPTDVARFTGRAIDHWRSKQG